MLIEGPEGCEDSVFPRGHRTRSLYWRMFCMGSQAIDGPMAGAAWTECRVGSNADVDRNGLLCLSERGSHRLSTGVSGLGGIPGAFFLGILSCLQLRPSLNNLSRQSCEPGGAGHRFHPLAAQSRIAPIESRMPPAPERSPCSASQS